MYGTGTVQILETPQTKLNMDVSTPTIFSRAHLLIEKEYENFQKDKPWGIEAHPLRQENIFEWMAKIKGLQDTVWEGGTFTLYIKFDENFNVRPPEVCFHTIPFHPNVDMLSGRPCIDFLDDFSQWKDSNSLTKILTTVQDLLANPDLNKPINPEAAEMIMRSPHAYRQMVLDCVVASQRVEGSYKGIDPAKYIGEAPHSGLESRVRFKIPDDANCNRKQSGGIQAGAKVAKLSFEDYHITWSGIATSKARHDLKNPLLEAIKDNPALQKAHLGLPQEEIEEQMKRQLEEHETLMYGRFQAKPSEEEEKAMKLARLNKMKKIYLPPRISPTSLHTTETMPPPPSGKAKEEPWEKEVDDLVAWTDKLDASTIEA
ncbi:ubiquitin-conjugating enzyme E2 U-like isoform X2 [Mercenaria mercenaria]|uniref:ubiquitin-conjugating enzyme E2 U-like isoform X2 n=1 Tax=Mercenaria mercenaria TaxID=6596 RepID=UPI00234F6E55|nr:ubiquitin-conjugating enzyme E2 U-like isoform X2 [Mercenaria mercenaria]